LLAALVSSLALAAAPPVDVSAARAYAAQRPGTVAFAVRSETGFTGVRADRAFPSASVLKAMLLVAYARHARERAFTAASARC
jgi:beta-lactamase class A